LGLFTSGNRREKGIRRGREMKGNRGAGAATPNARVRLQNLYSHCSCVVAEEEYENEDRHDATREL